LNPTEKPKREKEGTKDATMKTKSKLMKHTCINVKKVS
jgi:hypothetical protein